jgi:predicted ferric reductase
MNTLTKRRILNSIWLVNIAIISVFWFLAHKNNLTSDTGGLLIAFGSLLGYMAAYLLLTQLVLISGARWLEQRWGLDRLAGSHAANGKVAFYFVLLHFILVISGYTLRNGDNILTGYLPQLIETVFSRWYFLMAALAWDLLFVVVVTSIVMVRKRLPYELWHFIHFLAYAAVLFPIFHQINAGQTANGYPLFKAYWIGLFIFSFAAILYFKWIRPLWVYMQQKFVVDEVVEEAEDVVSIYIKGNNIAGFKYEAGQFAFWWFISKDLWWQPHPFTISSSPGDGRLRITVKSIGDGSNAIQRVQPGTAVLINGPYGRFTEAVRSKSRRLFIAGGIGITPLAAQLKASSSKNDTLIYGVRGKKDLALKTEISQTEAKLIAVFSDEKHKGALHGRVDKELLEKHVKDIKERDIFLCGPLPMMDGVESALKEIGVSDAQIHTERFRL